MVTMNFDNLINDIKHIEYAINDLSEYLQNSPQIIDLSIKVSYLDDKLQVLEDQFLDIDRNIENIHQDMAHLRDRMIVAEDKLIRPDTDTKPEIPNQKENSKISNAIDKQKELPILEDYAELDKWYEEYLKEYAIDGKDN